jgi:hypothetical protein
MKQKLRTSVFGALVCVCAFAGFAKAQGGELIAAEYGFGHHRADVTQQVRSFMHDGVLQFDVNGKSFGVDPARGHVKELFIRIRHWDGQIEEFHFPEYAHVNLALDPDRGYEHHDRDLHIMRAYYGAAGHFIDVTEQLRSMKHDGRLFLRVDSRSLGVNPEPGVPKVLRVLYWNEGERKQVVVPEHSELRLP